MAGTVALSPGKTTLTFTGVTFTADLTTVITAQLAADANRRWQILGGALTVTGNTAACAVQLKGSTTGVYAAWVVKADGTLAATGYGAQPQSTIYFGALPEPLVKGESLVIGGGAANALLDGHIFLTLIPA